MCGLKASIAGWGVAAVALTIAGQPMAAPYEFVPSPSQSLNRVYRIDRATGEVTSCQYALKEGTIGVALCFGSGEGAGSQTPGEYGLVSSRHTNESGIFRVNYRTGEMSVCYNLDDAVVCTPQAGPIAPTGAPPPATQAPATPAPAPMLGARPGTGTGQRMQ